MARWALILYLSVAAAAGPWWLCCCMSAQVRDWLAARRVPPTPTGDDVPPCCCCKQRGQEEAPAAPKPSPTHHCPCKETRPTVYTASGAGSGKAVEQGQFSAPSAALDGEVCPLDAVHRSIGQTTLQESLAFPYGSGRDLLASLHILRC